MRKKKFFFFNYTFFLFESIQFYEAFQKINFENKMRLYYLFAIFLIFATFSLAFTLDAENGEETDQEDIPKLDFKRNRKMTTKSKMHSITKNIISTTTKRTTASTTRKSLIAKKIFNFNH